MIIDNLHQLDRAIDALEPHQRLFVERVNWDSLWPRPSIWGVDDYKSGSQRANDWLALRKARGWLQHDPMGIMVQKCDT